jgi:diguanylate cyclase (GGDEF)-like protein
MATPKEAPLSSNQPDLQVLAVLGAIHRVLLVLVTGFSAITLAGWVIPSIGRVLPHYWTLMKANNAFVVLLCGLSLGLSEPRRSKNAVRVSKWLAIVAIVVSAIFVCERLRGISLPIDTLLAADAASANPGIVSIEICGTFLLIGFVLRNLRARKRLLSYFVDGATLGLVMSMLTFTSRYLFGVSHIFGVSPHNPMSLQTFLSLGIFTWLIVNRRAEYGAFSVLLGSQIGGKTVRFTAPFALLLPYLFAFARELAIRSNRVTDASATAGATTALSILAFCLVLVLGRRTNDLENAIRELSLRDELTGLYNRRGFYILAEQALRLALRAGEPFFVLFIDVDDLKKTNDALGHDIGSELLREVASLIERTFRETDVIARLGGDEFVVVGRLGGDSTYNPVARLEEGADYENSLPGRRFPIGFSLGLILADATSSETLEQLLQQADAIMYEAKRIKKAQRASGVPVLA